MRFVILTLASAFAILCVCGCWSRSGTGGNPKKSLVEHGRVAFDVSPDGEEIIFSSAGGDLFLLDLNTSAVTQVTDTEVIELNPAFAPDGRTVAYSAGQDLKSGFQIFTINLDNKAVQQVTSDPSVSDATPSFSSDGSRIAFARAHRIRPYSMGGWTADQYDACVVDSKGGAVRRITRQNYYAQGSTRFLGKQEHLVYSADPPTEEGGASFHLFTADLASGSVKFLTPKTSRFADHFSEGGAPGVSSDGTKIVFTSDRNRPYFYDLFVMNSDGTAPTALNLTHLSRFNKTPVFMPDGRQILFLAGTEFNAGSRPIFSLWRVNTDGSNPQQIAGSDLFTAPLRWKP